MKPQRYLIMCITDDDNAKSMFCENLEQVTELGPEFAKENKVTKVYVYQFYDVGHVGFTLQHHKNALNGTKDKHNKRWSAAEERELIRLYKSGDSLRSISQALCRTRKATQVRLTDLRKRGAV